MLSKGGEKDAENLKNSKEATNAAWIVTDSDVNLIKFCDVREFLLTMNEEQIIEAIRKAIDIGIEQALFYCFYYSNILYPELNLERYFECFDRIDVNDLEKFGEREYGSPQKWKRDFLFRIINGSKEEIENKDEFYKLM